VSLRARLTLFFVVIVVLPVAVATAYGWQAVARSSQRQVQAELEQARRSAVVAFGTRADRAQQAMTVLADDPALLQAMAAGDAARVQAVLRGQHVTDLLLAVTAPDGRVLGRAGDTSPGFLPGIGRAPLAMLLPREPMVRSWPTLQRRSADLNSRGCSPVGSRRCLLGTVTAGIWMDNQELQRLAASTLDADLTLAVGDVPWPAPSAASRPTTGSRPPTASAGAGRPAARW